MADEQMCFVIAPIGEPESDVRKRSDQILKHILKPAAKGCGYKAIRADEISEPGIITSQVIQHVVEDPLVIADLTGRNPNVFYELAIRHAIKKPLVQIIKKGEAIPFDVAGTRTVHVDHHDLDSVDEAKEEITKQIKAVEKDTSEIDTPISVALDLQILRQSDNPEQRSLADMFSAMSELRQGLAALEEKIGDPTKLLPPDYFEYLNDKFGPGRPLGRLDIREVEHLTRQIAETVTSDRLSAADKDQIREMAEYLNREIRRSIRMK